jgi:hypothetical protein
MLRDMLTTPLYLTKENGMVRDRNDMQKITGSEWLPV